MEHAVIPAPLQVDMADGPGFAFPPGTAVGDADPVITSIVGRFCARFTRRTGVALVPAPAGAVPDVPAVTVELGAAGDLAELPGPAGRDVEAAIWAETITGFGDLSFLLLPRLPGVADKAWSARPATGRSGPWPAHRDRLARHGRLRAQDGLEYFRAATVWS